MERKLFISRNSTVIPAIRHIAKYQYEHFSRGRKKHGVLTECGRVLLNPVNVNNTFEAYTIPCRLCEKRRISFENFKAAVEQGEKEAKK